MPTYKVYWYSNPAAHQLLDEETPVKAYEAFLDKCRTFENESVCVTIGDEFFAFEDHIVMTKDASNSFRNKTSGKQLEFQKLKEKGRLPEGVKSFSDYIGHSLLLKKKKEAEKLRLEFEQRKKEGSLPEGINTAYQFLAHIRSVKAAEMEQRAERKRDEEAIRVEEEAKQLRLKEEEERRNFLNQLADYLRTSGFEALDKSHLSFIFALVRKSLELRCELTTEERGLLGAVLEDSKTYRLLNLRMAEMASRNLAVMVGRQEELLVHLDGRLSEISSTTKEMKTSSKLVGIASAWHLAEEIREGFGAD